MKKIIIAVFTIAMGIGLSIALAQPLPGPPPPHPGMGPPPPHPGATGNDARQRREAWRRFQQEHPEEAQAIMQMMQQYPELRGMVGPGAGSRQGPGMRGKGRKGRRDDINPAVKEHMRQLQQKREEAMTLAEKYRNTEDKAEKKKIEKQMRTLLSDIYELRLEVMRFRVKKVEEKLAAVKDELSKYEKDHDGVIDAWFNQLTNSENYKKF